MPTPVPDQPPSGHRSPPAARYLRGAGEVVLFALVALAPWPFASNDPPFESALCAGVLLLAALWSAHAAVTGRFAIRFDVVVAGLGGIALWSAVQLVPLPESVVGTLSPTRLEWHRVLVPEVAETLPGETEGVLRPPVLTLSADPSATRTFLARVLAVLLVYAAARNWLASSAGFRRLAWVVSANGVALAVLALGQFFSSPGNVMYWSVRCEGNVFGPFVCRNHYPDYAAVCLGLAVGLLLPGGRNREGGPTGPLTPRAVALVAVVGFVGASIAFSLSRAGILATVVAAAGAWGLNWARGGGGAHRGTVALLAGAVLVALGVFGWFGTERVERRLSTLSSAETAASRAALWRDTVRLLPQFWGGGTGGGTFVWAEPLVRTGRPLAVVENAHNEYLEAAVEGGAVRFGFTLLLVLGVAVTLGRGVLRKRDRSSGSLLLGAWFGLAAVAAHSVVEFAIHMPAVALLTATVTGYAMAASGSSSEARAAARTPGRGWCAVGGGLVVAGLALFVALDARSRERVHRLKLAADVAYGDVSAPDRLARRAEYLDARAALRPDDPVALFDAAQGRIDAAVEETLAGTFAGGEPPDRFPPEAVSRHLVPALRFLRAARAANPIAPKPHTRLGLLVEYCARSEPAGTHFDRAKRLLPVDPDLWFTSGKAALRQGDADAAWRDWRQSLVLSPRYLDVILAASREVLTPDQIRERVLPDDPVLLLTAANQLFPDRAGDTDARRPFLEAVATGSSRPGATAPQLVASAQAHDELGRTEEALRAWRQAIAAAPDDLDIRDRYCRWLEQQERYEDAVEQLEWLHSRSPRSPVQDRLDAARHGLKLQRGIGAP